MGRRPLWRIAALLAVPLLAAAQPAEKASPPVAPSNPRADAIGISTITWKWADNSKDETGFKVWSDPGAAAPTTLRVTVGAYMTMWPQGGLFPNTQHTFQVAATGAGGDSAKTPPLTAWTRATTPLPPVVGNPTGSTLDVAVDAGDGNSSITEYAIQCATTGQWVQPGGALGTAAAWRTATAWGRVTVTGLAGYTQHGFAVTARNGAGVVTGSGAVGAAMTTPAVPDVVGLSKTEATAAINRAGLLLGTVTEQHSASVPANVVMAQNPPPGTGVFPGTPVNLTVSLGPTQVAVPNVLGMTRSQAAAAIRAAGLAPGAVSQANSATVPKSGVISQHPVAGTLAAPGSLVTLVVSLGAARTKVPEVTGLNRGEAEAALREAGLVVGAVSELFHATIVSGNVLYQDPAAGADVTAGTAVKLVVSKGTKPVTVPGVTGMDEASARGALETAGLQVGVVGEESSDTVAAGVVLRQDPAATTDVAPGFFVNLTVSSGPAPAGCMGTAEKVRSLLEQVRGLPQGL